MQQLIVATRNVHKSNEFQRILGPDFAVYDLSEHPEIPETVERGKTFEENAVLKATGASKELSGLIIADDSGLEVDALGGAPGIYSARYASQNASDRQNIDKLLSELARTSARQEQRSARFRCVLALAESGRILGVFEGVVAGTIIELPRGRNGFGYDPIFLPKGLDQTFGELAPAEKDRLSHRALALEELRAFLDTMPGQQKGNRDSYHWLGYRV
ncbi:MAG: non-canonical purine NTP pyrophosphatase, RdgB/HAM1 family [Verrucomicrobia bacterium]|nr:MAG: non-canonical purine NTP pyrophosphatase, RdgB/HAM1 family [Verrucomicrobiota bacterium]